MFTSIVRIATAAAARAAAAAQLAALVLQSDRRELAFLRVAHRCVACLVLLGVLATRLAESGPGRGSSDGVCDDDDENEQGGENRVPEKIVYK